MNLEEMRARLTEITEKLGEIHTEAGDASLSEERQTEWDSLDSEYTKLTSDVERAEKRADRMKELAVSSPKHVERGTDPGAPAFVKTRSDDEIYNVTELRMDASSPEHYSELLHDNAMRAVDKARYSRVTRKEKAQEAVEELLDTVDNEHGDLAKRLLVTGSPLYERAFGKAIKALSTAGLSHEEQRAMAMGAGATGSFAVPFQLDPSVILTNAGTINPLREMARVEKIVGKEWQGVTSAGITVTRFAEAAEATDDSPTLAQPTVKAERVQGFVPFSIEVDQDWNQFRSEITRMLNDAKEREEAAAFTTGTGTPPDANGVVTTLTGNTVDSTGANTFAVGDVYAVEEALAPRFRAKAQWLANKAIYNKIRQFAVSDGHALWERIGNGQPPELLGYKAQESAEMDAVTTAGSKILLFGDFEHFLIVDRVGMEVELVPHLFHVANNRPTGQRGIYAIWRNNSKILVDSAFKLLTTDAD